MPLVSLSEIKLGDMIVEPITKVFKPKNKAKMLEEQIRDSYPCDVEPKEEENEEI